MSTPKYQDIRNLALLAKDALISVLIFGSTIFLMVSIYQSAMDQSIIFEPITVPSPFIDKGYTPEITTIRLIDEVKKINAIANTTKRRNSHATRQLGGDISNLTSGSLPSTIDIRAIQSFIREIFGIKKRTISGDITLSQSDKNEAYHVRIRLSPDDLILVDQIFNGTLEEILQAVSLKMIEKIDPVVAASYYRSKGQTLETLKMVDVAYNSDNVEDKTWGLTQRVYILIEQKKYALAKADLDRVLTHDPNSPNGLGMLAYLYNEQGQHQAAKEAADKQIALSPELPHGYLNKARANVGLGIDDENLYVTALSKKKLRPGHLIMIGKYLEGKNKLELARTAYLKGAVEFPNNALTNLHHGRRLLADGHIQLAYYYLSKAQVINPKNQEAAELLKNPAFKELN